MAAPVMMPALSVGRALKLAPVLEQISALTPPPTPKGRYVLGKALDKATAEKLRYEKAYFQFLESVVTQGPDGKPIFNTTESGQVSFMVQADKTAEHAKWKEDVESEVVTFDGIRQITHAELGDCPITIAQCAVLVASGLLEDVEPA